MTYLIQNALFGDESGYDSFVSAIKAPIITIPYVFWEYTLDLKIAGIPANRIIPFGTCALVVYGLEHGWAVSWDKEYNYSDLCCLGKEFINHDLELFNLRDLNQLPLGKIYIREDSGFNIIKGRVVEGSFDVNTGDHESWKVVNGDTKMVWAPVKTIEEEYRVWVIGRKVVTASLYRSGRITMYANADSNSEVVDYAQSIVPRLPISVDNLVVDIFRTPQGLKVGEINCIHCSGWYAADAGKVAGALSRIPTNS